MKIRLASHYKVRKPKELPEGAGLTWLRAFSPKQHRWLIENCTGSWTARHFEYEDEPRTFGIEIEFENARDGMLFKLTWD